MSSRTQVSNKGIGGLSDQEKDAILDKEKVEGAVLDKLVKNAVELAQKGTISISDVLGVIAETYPPEILPVPEVLPMPREITPEQRAAIERITEVFGSVVPVKRRALQSNEVASLLDEKEVLNQLKKLAEDRHQDIRTSVFNHLDVEAEEKDLIGSGTPRDENGHYVLKGEAQGGAGVGQKFTREVRGGSPSLSPEALKVLVDDPEVEFDHEAYLAVTTPVRILDENKLMLALKKNPRLIMAIARATRPGRKTAALYVRKA